MKGAGFLMVCLAVAGLLSGCAVAVVGGAAAGGYYVAKEERSVTEVANDAAITLAVKTRLIAEKELSAGGINVDTYKGVVVLSGRVNTAKESRRATKIAHGVESVTKVVNGLAVIPVGNPSDNS